MCSSSGAFLICLPCSDLTARCGDLVFRNLPIPDPGDSGEFLLYQTEDGRTRIEDRFEGETVWLTQAAMAKFFDTTPQNITIHIRTIYEDGELQEASTCKKYSQVRQEGERRLRRTLKHYSLDMILAVGCRVRSHRGTQFRRTRTVHRRAAMPR